MGIWLHTHTVATLALGELAEIQGDVSVETTSLGYGRGCRMFKLHPTSMAFICKEFKHLLLLPGWTNGCTLTLFLPPQDVTPN